MGCVVKCVFDVFVFGMLLFVAMLFFLFIGLLVWLISCGLVFYCSIWMGVYGCEFCVYKFWLMYFDVDKCCDDLFAFNEIFGGMLFKMCWDLCVMLIGCLLCKFFIDELLQLFNVFIGLMSLVGSRLLLPDEVEKYHCYVHWWLFVKFGMMGLW